MNTLDQIKELNLPIGSYAVFGSSLLNLYGIRESRDIDIVCTQEVYEQFKIKRDWKEVTGKNGEKCLHKDNYSIGVGWDCTPGYNPTTEYLIKNAEIIDGVPFVKLEEIIKWKSIYGREKDLKDIELIYSSHFISK